MDALDFLVSQDFLARYFGEWSMHLGLPGVMLRLAIALVLGAAIGWERTNKRHSAGLRTFITITLAGTAAGLIDFFLLEVYGSSTFFISGTAVLSATIISARSILFNSRTQIKGLTTAAALWMMGLLGVAVDIGLYMTALCLFAVLLFTLSVLPVLENFLDDKSNHFEVHLELNSAKSLPLFAATIRKLGMKIDDIEYNPAYKGSGVSVYSVSFTISNEELKKYKSHQEIIDALGTLDYIVHIEEI